MIDAMHGSLKNHVKMCVSNQINHLFDSIKLRVSSHCCILLNFLEIQVNHTSVYGFETLQNHTEAEITKLAIIYPRVLTFPNCCSRAKETRPDVRLSDKRPFASVLHLPRPEIVSRLTARRGEEKKNGRCTL